MANKKRAHKKNRITGNYYKGERPEDDYYIGSNNQNTIENSNSQITKNEFESEESDDDSEMNIKGNQKRFHKKNRATGNTATYKDDHRYQDYENSDAKLMASDYFLKKQGKLSLQTILFDNESILENSQIDKIRHKTYGKNVDADQKSPYMLQHRLSFQLEQTNEK